MTVSPPTRKGLTPKQLQVIYIAVAVILFLIINFFSTHTPPQPPPPPPITTPPTPTPTPTPTPKSARFVDNGDQTITDKSTGLMWTKNANLPGTYKTWHEAKDYVASMNSGAGTYGYTDWRLPGKEELEGLIKGWKDAPYSWLKSQGFTNVQSGYYWSSTSYAHNTSGAWIVDMYDGNVFAYDKSGYYYVWPVRSGY
ncbi:protein containing DUF1566 [Candidatus Magnetobacterium bavaricum]|uniref:Protein containing DUF1566 n=1 Tax=Candidatus Magnetobacterium bavaricum TaxID=29290 RepID=A0A0F3GPR0_9BACT|nr:protein containing DUF1566 [Candidatus Magnetobacterium bavaricum]